MRYFFCTFISLACVVNAGGTTPSKMRQETLKCVVVPGDQAIVAIASQPDSPLSFEDVRVLSCVGRQGMESYRIRNRGAKPIRNFTIAGWTSGGTGFKWGWGGTTPEEVLMPGEVAPAREQDIEILPLTKDMRKKQKLDGSIEGVLILLVVSVEYADGSRFNDEAASNALENYFDKVAGRMP